MSGSNRNAYALVTLAVAMIGLQVAAAFGVVAGARALSQSEPVAAALRTAGVVASSIAHTAAQNGAAGVGCLAGRVWCDSEPTVALLTAPGVASIASGDEAAECWIAGPAGQVRRVALNAMSDAVGSGSCESRCVIAKRIACDVLCEVSCEVTREVTRELSREVSRRVAAAKPII